MTATPSFINLMKEAKSKEDIKRQPSLPQGDYILEVTKADPEAKVPVYAVEEMGEDATCLRVYFAPCEPADDKIDEDELEAIENWKNKVLSLDFVRAEDGVRFFDAATETGLLYDLGLKPDDYFDGDDGFNMEEACKDMVRQQVIGTVSHRKNKKAPDFPYETISGTAPIK